MRLKGFIQPLSHFSRSEQNTPYVTETGIRAFKPQED